MNSKSPIGQAFAFPAFISPDKIKRIAHQEKQSRPDRTKHPARRIESGLDQYRIPISYRTDCKKTPDSSRQLWDDERNDEFECVIDNSGIFQIFYIFLRYLLSFLCNYRKHPRIKHPPSSESIRDLED